MAAQPFLIRAWNAVLSREQNVRCKDNALLTKSGGSTGTLAATTVAVAGLTTIGSAIDVSDFEKIFVQIDNTHASAVVFDAFEIQISPDGTNFETAFSTSGDYTSPAGILIGCSGDLTVLAAAATGWFILDVTGLASIQLQASANITQSVGVAGLWSAN